MTPPGYWMDETAGWLIPAMRRFLEEGELSARDLELIRAYIQQWIDSPVWDQNPAQTLSGRAELKTLRHLAHALTDRRSIADWLGRAEDQGLDPL